MGNNSAFSAFESVTIAVYDAGVLDKKLLEKLASCFRDQDADSGGYSGTLAKDGKDLYEIVATVAGEPFPPMPEVPKNWKDRTLEQESAMDAYHETLSRIFRKVANVR